MYEAILALLLALCMILLTVLKGRKINCRTFFCRKSELVSIIDNISDDCVIQIWIGRDPYEHKRGGNSRRRNL